MNHNPQENRQARGKGKPARARDVPSHLEHEAAEEREATKGTGGSEGRIRQQTHADSAGDDAANARDDSPIERDDSAVGDASDSLEQLEPTNDDAQRTLARQDVGGEQVPQRMPEGLGAGGKRQKINQARARDDGPQPSDERDDLPGGG